MKMKKEDYSLGSILIWVIVPVISFILNAIIGDIQDKNGILSLILSSLFIGVLVASIYYLYSTMASMMTYNFFSLKLKEGIEEFATEYNKRIEYKNDIDNSSTQTLGIIPEHELAEMEASCDYEEIWVISNDLSAEVGQYKDIVPQNLKRGIKYKFFYRRTAQNEIRIAEIRRKNGGSKNAEYFCLEDDFFFIVTNLDFTIYNPYSEDKIGFMGIELPGAEELYAIKVARNLTDAIASRLLLYINSN